MARRLNSRTGRMAAIAAAALVAASLPGLGRFLLAAPTADRPEIQTPAPAATQTAPARAGGAARRGGGGGRGGVGTAFFTAADTNKDGALTRVELKATLEQWFATWNGANAPSLTADQVRAGAVALFAPAAQNQTPNPAQVEAMIAALPARAAATPARPRRVLVLAKSTGFVHATIPLAARMVEELGRKTGAWSTVISYNPADINTKNLQQFDAIFLASTTGAFADDALSPANTTAQRQALLAFVRGGKGLAGVHAASDSYHTGTETAEVAAGPGFGVGRAMLADGDANRDQRLSRAEMSAMADAWFDRLDPAKTGTLNQDDFAPRFTTLLSASDPARGAGARGGPGNVGTWPDWNKMIGGSFLAHPWQHVWVKVDDPASPITAPFKGQAFEITDETYTFTRDSFSRDNVHVLLSIDVSKMTPEDVARENRPWDHDYALSWIRADGKGRVFYAAHGHEPRIYAMTPMLEHYLAGIQYAIGDLKADDRPRPLK